MRKLWTSVVLQALEDIKNKPTQSVLFSDAVAFFTGAGTWRDSRRFIGDFLGVHPDELEAIGRRYIAARMPRR